MTLDLILRRDELLSDVQRALLLALEENLVFLGSFRYRDDFVVLVPVAKNAIDTQ